MMPTTSYTTCGNFRLAPLVVLLPPPLALSSLVATLWYVVGNNASKSLWLQGCINAQRSSNGKIAIMMR